MVLSSSRLTNLPFLNALFKDSTAASLGFIDKKGSFLFHVMPRQRRAASRLAKPRISIARAACFFGRGRRPDAPYFILLFQKQVKCSRKGNVFTFFSLLRKEPKVAEGPRPSRLPENGSKLYRLYFFVILPALVPIPVCGATRFFGCFEPVRKGYCSADARPMFFENWML